MVITSSSFRDSKQHLLNLDALRGIAAIMVVLMHGFEIYCKGDSHKMIINHGYLAVDFFFMLSGYVMAHAYDDRWDKMTIGDFLKRRLIRLHPLIIIGMTLGALLFFFQASSIFPKIANTSISQLLLTLVIGYTIIPVSPSMDIRGWNEMHPLNGATWSLFFEYIANILHVFILRKLSNKILSILVFLAAVALIHLAVMGKTGDLIGGWSTEPEQLKIGITRLLFPYMAGMLLRRLIHPTRKTTTTNTFYLTSIILICVLCFNRFGGNERLWLNGLYESMVVILVFPIIIYLGANNSINESKTTKVSNFLGNISYPLYITHFPLIGVYYAWVTNNNITLQTGIWSIPLVLVISVLTAFMWLKIYDEPVRKWLAKKFL